MYDQQLFVKTLSRFAVVLPSRYDIEATLTELTQSVTAVLGLSGSGVTMAEEGQLRFVTAVSQASGELERNQERWQAGPCRDAYDTGEVVRVTDVREESTRWPEFSATATSLAVAGVAGIPMRLADRVVGALNLYSPQPREWLDSDVLEDLDRSIQLALADAHRGVICDLSEVVDDSGLDAVDVLATAGRYVRDWSGVPVALVYPERRVRRWPITPLVGT